jgi:hypothetical protein
MIHKGRRKTYERRASLAERCNKVTDYDNVKRLEKLRSEADASDALSIYRVASYAYMI